MQFLLAQTVTEPAAAASAAASSATGSSISGWTIIIAVAVAWAIGVYLAKAIKMKDYGWKLGLMFACAALAAVVCIFGTPKWGIDLRGGTILNYQVDEQRTAEAKIMDEEEGRQSRPDESYVDMDALIQSLTKRINPSGVKEIVIRPYGGNQVEIIIPEVSEAETELIKDIIKNTGFLKFKIIADRARNERVWNAGELALASPDEKVKKNRFVYDGDEIVGEWVELGKEESEAGEPTRYRVSPSGMLTRELIADRMEVLATVDSEFQVEGKHLRAVQESFDENGNPSVTFQTTGEGSALFGSLTGMNLPDKAADSYAKLGIVLDEVLLSAPTINSRISTNGEISGRFTQEEVTKLVRVLRAGKLPAVLQPEPISENNISPLLGVDTIEKGTWAIGASLIAVLIFMLVYYHFAGVVACLALAFNLLLIVALMILIKAAFTLPGLAGLVLTVGMSVDANVLIFERIREELSRGAALRMAIRNGFARATTTIVDANVTTLITAFILYAIGTDQIKGFAVTLILGILMSMFTAIFCSRVIFDIAERRGWIKKLSMSRLIGETKYSFISARKLAAAFSAVVILVGMSAVVMRGSKMLDIDFTGGTSVQSMLTEGMPIDEVRKRVGDIAEDVWVTQVNPKDREPNTVYKIDTSIEDKETLKTKVVEAFTVDGKSLLTTHALDFTAPVSIAADSTSSFRYTPTDFMLASSPLIGAVAGPQEAQPPVETTEAITQAAEAVTEAVQEVVDPAAGQVVAEEPVVTEGEVVTGSEMPQEVMETTPETTTPDDSAVPATESTATETTPEAQPPVVPGAAETATDEGDVKPFDATEGGVYLSRSSISLDEKMNARTLTEKIRQAAETSGGTTPLVKLSAEGWNEASDHGYTEWDVKFSTDAEETASLLGELKSDMDSEPVWLSANMIGSKIAGDMKMKAITSILLSLLAIVGYLWIRFQHITFGLAAVVALVHDVLVTLGAVALSFWLAKAAGFLLIEEFKISLPIVAAFMTVIGYSLNDTIVVFDRIREVKGKSPELTGDMIDASINQTLSRTLLTSITTLIVVAILYTFGGEGIHGFAFALLIGVIVGTYSSIFVASPALLWMSRLFKDDETPSQRATAEAR